MKCNSSGGRWKRAYLANFGGKKDLAMLTYAQYAPLSRSFLSLNLAQLCTFVPCIVGVPGELL